MSQENNYTLTECLECGSIMYDENPSEDSRNYSDEDIENVTLKSMIIVFDNKDKVNGYWSCPVCKTDGHLIDCTKDL